MKATQAQIDFLYRLNADFDADTITKQQATALLEVLVAKREAENGRSNV